MNDAEEIAREIKNLPLLARVFGQAASIACYERDYEWSIDSAEQALAVYKLLSSEPPPSLLSNLAIAQLHTGQLDDALQTLRVAVTAIEDNSPILAQVLVNTAICLRHKGEIDAASHALDTARSKMSSKTPYEAWIELELVAAKIALERKDYASLIMFLSAAAQWLDEGLVNVFRLHHRRGLREQYIERFEGLLRELPERGSANSILQVIATIRGNSLGDWLVLLEWAKVAVPQKAAIDELEAIKDIIVQLRRFGAPHLFGYHEKYDDAWQPMNSGSAWDELSKVANRLTNRGVQGPFDGSRLSSTVTRLERQLSDRHALATLTYAGQGAILWIIFGEHYVRVQLPSASLLNWKRAQLMFSIGELDRTKYAQELQILLAACTPLLQTALSELVEFKPQSIKYLCDFDGCLPFTALMLENEELADAVAAGNCEIRIVPAIVCSQEESQFVPQAIAAISDSTDNLLLSKYESEALARATGAILKRITPTTQDKSLRQLIGAAEGLIVSTHGQPLEIFTDAIFAAMNEAGVISVMALQEEAEELDLKLILLNVCHSGTASKRNFQQRFRTSDAVTFPSLFLLNRQAVVSASLWRISDTVSYIYACLVGDSLAQGDAPALALSSSTAKIKGLTKSQAISFLEKITDTDARQSAIQRLSSAPDVGLFSNPYLYGGIALFGLL